MNNPTSRRRRPTLITIFLFLAVFGAAQTNVQAQEPAAPTLQPQVPPPTTIPALAQRTADALTAKKAKRVAIPDFAAANGEPTMDKLGAKLAADFRAALEQQPHKFKIVGNDELNSLLAKHQSIASDMQMTQAAVWLLHEDKIDSWAIGVLGQRDGNVVLAIGVFHHEKDQVINDDSFELQLGAVAELNPLDPQPPASTLPPAGGRVNKDAPRGSAKYGFPACIYCPQAEYSDDGVKAHLQGVVMLVATVAADGHAEDIRVLKRMPLGLTEKAVEAVQKWRFVPAAGPDGKPIAVRQNIEVQFHLY